MILTTGKKDYTQGLNSQKKLIDLTFSSTRITPFLVSAKLSKQ